MLTFCMLQSYLRVNQQVDESIHMIQKGKTYCSALRCPCSTQEPPLTFFSHLSSICFLLSSSYFHNFPNPLSTITLASCRSSFSRSLTKSSASIRNHGELWCTFIPCQSCASSNSHRTDTNIEQLIEHLRERTTSESPPPTAGEHYARPRQHSADANAQYHLWPDHLATGKFSPLPIIKAPLNSSAVSSLWRERGVFWFSQAWRSYRESHSLVAALCEALLTTFIVPSRQSPTSTERSTT